MAKYIIQAGVDKVDYWSAKGKIEVSENCTQEELEYLHSVGYEGVFKIETPEKPKK